MWGADCWLSRWYMFNIIQLNISLNSELLTVKCMNMLRELYSLKALLILKAFTTYIISTFCFLRLCYDFHMITFWLPLSGRAGACSIGTT